MPIVGPHKPIGILQARSTTLTTFRPARAFWLA
ncbi:hypothetical protein GA0070563_10446 [Micromonospora carbonacea]|uniref:Uncharacterized protein n=1 Tax=Micromonospora carbonacea TaxID=47853 RepID=A0A1C4WV08_9ACTN|nr:hypothetical protein GA0070563_10446 [Micromonospora carbonacea]